MCVTVDDIIQSETDDIHYAAATYVHMEKFSFFFANCYVDTKLTLCVSGMQSLYICINIPLSFFCFPWWLPIFPEDSPFCHALNTLFSLPLFRGTPYWRKMMTPILLHMRTQLAVKVTRAIRRGLISSWPFCCHELWIHLRSNCLQPNGISRLLALPWRCGMRSETRGKRGRDD